MILFGTSSELIFDINLILQLFIFGLLSIGGYIMRMKRVLKNHGYIMVIATLSNLLLTLLVMAPSLIINWDAVVTNPTSPGVIITLIHVVLGLIAIVGGTLFSVRFLSAIRRQRPLQCGKRQSMRSVTILWVASLILGIGFYVFYYV